MATDGASDRFDETTRKTGEVTRWIRQSLAGDADAVHRVYEAVYPRLLSTARRLLRLGFARRTLLAEDLVHEAYCKLADRMAWESSGHLMAVMARTMRHVMIDYEKLRGAKKRGGGMKQVPLSGILVSFESRQVDLLDLHDALERLQKRDRAAARVVELRHFHGLSMSEVAEALRIGQRSAERDWEYAKRWLAGELVA